MDGRRAATGKPRHVAISLLPPTRRGHMYGGDGLCSSPTQQQARRAVGTVRRTYSKVQYLAGVGRCTHLRYRCINDSSLKSRERKATLAYPALIIRRGSRKARPMRKILVIQAGAGVWCRRAIGRPGSLTEKGLRRSEGNAHRRTPLSHTLMPVVETRAMLRRSGANPRAMRTCLRMRALLTDVERATH